MSKIRDIIRCIQPHCTVRSIANTCNVSRTAVQRVVNIYNEAGYEKKYLLGLSDSELSNIVYGTKKTNHNERYADLRKRLPTILKDLKTPHMTKEILWAEYRAEYPEGYSYSQFCFYVLEEKQKQPDGSICFNHKYGDVMYLDFAGDTFTYTGWDGEEYALKLFVATLPASRFTYCGFFENEKTESWINGTQDALYYCGGVPSALVPDQAKAVVKKADRVEPEINAQFKQFADHVNTAVVPARPRSPRDKALVENTVNNLYRYIYPRLLRMNLRSKKELDIQLRCLLDEFNHRTMRDHNVSRRELLQSHERQALGSLPDRRYEYKSHQPPRKIGSTQHVFLKEDYSYYSVPEKFIGKKCEIYYTKRLVELYCDHERIASHVRTHKRGYYQTDPQHIESKARQFFTYTQNDLESKGRDIGEKAATMVRCMFKLLHPLQARKSAFALIGLSRHYPDERINKACARAIHTQAYKVNLVKSILVKGLENYDDGQQIFKTPDHENIRYKNI